MMKKSTISILAVALMMGSLAIAAPNRGRGSQPRGQAQTGTVSGSQSAIRSRARTYDATCDGTQKGKANGQQKGAKRGSGTGTPILDGQGPHGAGNGRGQAQKPVN